MKSHTLAEEIRRALVICLLVHFIEEHLSIYTDTFIREGVFMKAPQKFNQVCFSAQFKPSSN